MFGDGVHNDIHTIFAEQLDPWLSHASSEFWSTRLHYFKKGLYLQGGMVGDA